MMCVTCSAGEGWLWPLETVLGEEVWPPGVAPGVAWPPGVAQLQQV